ncbi:M20 family metallopeptidase [Falsiroseomonas selenitidurans]|uniref:M20 family metallopeptidase n=1 Tax=Falsiroseomonas selenitidurans TaxID=2716335 RepID=A0ABX1DYV3_9PROT|nr:M20 family metallopeptidase [Falsiroseomonas selenitidurans]NKC30080.1 M20 family metallopeptidase [Falsiroseomonas selenitidurans]
MSFTTDSLLAAIRPWVEHETPTDAPEAVSALMATVAAEAAAAGAKAETIAGRDGMGDHLLLRSPWGGEAPGILVLSHLDTVHPMGMLARMPFRVQDGIAYGPGIYDMKGGARLAFEAFLSFLRAGTPTPLPITYLFNADEEVGSPTSRALIRSLGAKAKFVLVTEPAREGGKIVTARKGAARFDLHVKGRAAHSGSRHQDGRSAIGELARQIVALHGMTDYARGITVNVGTIRGGTRPNVVAEEAHAAIDMRLPTPAIAEEMLARIAALRPHDPDVELTLTGGLNRPPYEKTPGIAALFDHARGLAAEIGFELQDLKTGGGSDGNFCADLAPVLDGLGADGKGGHTDFEQIYLESLVPRARLLRRLMETLV